MILVRAQIYRGFIVVPSQRRKQTMSVFTYYKEQDTIVAQVSDNRKIAPIFTPTVQINPVTQRIVRMGELTVITQSSTDNIIISYQRLLQRIDKPLMTLLLNSAYIAVLNEGVQELQPYIDLVHKSTYILYDIATSVTNPDPQFIDKAVKVLRDNSVALEIQLREGQQ